MLTANATAGIAAAVLSAQVFDFKQAPQQAADWTQIAREQTPFDASWHLDVGLNVGSCRREGPDVGAVNACGDLFVAGNHRLGARFHLDLEVGAGFMPKGASGSATFGVARTTGGPVYIALRPAFGFDFTPLFFFRIGPQLRVAVGDGAVPGIHGSVDLGTRVGPRLELGLRTFYGADGVSSSERVSLGWAFSFGALAFVRCIVL